MPVPAPKTHLTNIRRTFLSCVRDHSSSFSLPVLTQGSELALHGGMKWESREASFLLTEPCLPTGTEHFPGRWKIWLIRKLNQHLLLAAWALHLASLTAKCSPTTSHTLPLPPAAFLFPDLLAWSLTFHTHSHVVCPIQDCFSFLLLLFPMTSFRV